MQCKRSSLLSAPGSEFATCLMDAIAWHMGEFQARDVPSLRIEGDLTASALSYYLDLAQAVGRLGHGHSHPAGQALGQNGSECRCLLNMLQSAVRRVQELQVCQCRVEVVRIWGCVEGLNEKAVLTVQPNL